MAQTLEQLIEKAPGQLILSDDWNDLVKDVIDANKTFTQQLAAANQAIGDLKTATDTLRQDFTAYRNRIDPVIAEFFVVSIQTTQATYAIGQLAEIVVQVSDPLGGPLVAAGEAGRWVDFVATWGQLKAAPGFESIAGDGDRATSVRVDEQGIARALLHSDHAVGFAEADEAAVANSLATKPQGIDKSVAQLIVEADSPATLKSQGAFRVITQEYDRADTDTLRRYTDAYYVKFAPQITGRYVPPPRIWRDYRATVLAFAKSDAPPTAPQRRHGAESILVTFRDWIIPWLHLDYLDDTRLHDIVLDARTCFTSKVTADYASTANLMKGEVDGMVTSEGLIGKMRAYRVIDQALDGLTISNPPGFLPGLTQAVQHGVRIQHTLESAQADAVGVAHENVAFQVFTEAATRSDTNVSTVVDQVATLQHQLDQANGHFATIDTGMTGLQSSLGSVSQKLEATLSQGGAVQSLQANLAAVSNQFGTLNSSVTNLQASVSTVNGRVDAALAAGGELTSLRNDLNTVKGQVAGFQAINPTDVSTRLTEVVGLSNRLTAIEKKVG